MSNQNPNNAAPRFERPEPPTPTRPNKPDAPRIDTRTMRDEAAQMIDASRVAAAHASLAAMMPGLYIGVDLARPEPAPEGAADLPQPTAVSAARTHRIWIAGDYTGALKVVQTYCNEVGNCFAITPADYVYTGGAERGVMITRINYARFPADSVTIYRQCLTLALRLKDALKQRSFSIEAPGATYYFGEPE